MEYVEAYDRGICEFCGDPIDFYQEMKFIRRVGDTETRVSHGDCYNEGR